MIEEAADGQQFFTHGLTSSSSSSSSNSDTEAVFEDDIKILKLDVMLRDKAITELRQNFEKAKKERDDLKLTLEKFEDTEVSTCSKDCLKSYETLKEHYDNLTKDFNKSQFNLGAYKDGLASVEARLEVYKKNKAVFEDDIKILKLDVMLTDKAITELRQNFEKAKKERDDLKLTLEKFEGSYKNLTRLLDSQQSDKSKTGLGYDSQEVDSQVLENSESVTSLPDIAKSKVKTSETKVKNVSAPIIKD
nr:hypothetical protein [Tanacetum cinerariifolium]